MRVFPALLLLLISPLAAAPPTASLADTVASTVLAQRSEGLTYSRLSALNEYLSEDLRKQLLTLLQVRNRFFEAALLSSKEPAAVRTLLHSGLDRCEFDLLSGAPKNSKFHLRASEQQKDGKVLVTFEELKSDGRAPFKLVQTLIFTFEQKGDDVILEEIRFIRDGKEETLKDLLKREIQWFRERTEAKED